MSECSGRFIGQGVIGDIVVESGVVIVPPSSTICSREQIRVPLRITDIDLW